jgi:3',5'-cyclic AMP phosphodiesterase CpdA
MMHGLLYMIEFSSPLGFLAIREALDESLRSDITFLPIVGNHDVDGADGNTGSTLKIFNYFMGFEDSYQGYQVIEKENNAFIILNTFLPNEENRIGATQLAWLELRLAEISPSKDIFIFMHHPMFPAGAHSPLANREELHTLFTSYDNIVAVFAGHEHVYYHTVQDEIHYYVSGGAGSPLHTNTNGIAIHHMLGVVTSPNFRVDVLDDSGELITIE